MKHFFLKYCIVVLVCTNATIVFAQSATPIDSLLTVVTQQIKIEEYIAAEKLLDSLKTIPEYKIDSIKLKVDFALAMLYQTQNKDTEALEILLKGLTKIKSNPNSKYIAEYAFQIGRKFSNRENYKKALEYYKLVLINSEYKNDSLGMSKGYLGIGSIFLKLVRYGVGSDEEYEKNNDSTFYYHKKAIDYFPKNTSDKSFLISIYNNMIGYYFFKKDYETAENYGKKSFEISNSLGDSLKMVGTLNNLGAINSVKKDYKKAREYYLKGYNLVKNKSDAKFVEQRRRFLRNLADLFYRTGKHKKAYEYRVEYEYLRDSLELIIDNEKYAEYEAKYNLSEKEKLAEIEKNKRKNAELWLYVFSISTGVLILFLWLLYRSQKYKRQKQELEFQKENLLQERTLEKVQNDAQIKILNATIDGKEAERRHIAEILHDSVSALLSSAGLHLQAAKIELKDNAPEEIEKSQVIVREAGEKIRDLSHKLISSVLLKFGLEFAMDDLCNKYSNSKLTFESDSKDIQRYSSEFEIKIHSIIEELINNIMKHSNAAKAQILLKQFEGQLQIRIFDDGDGFDVEKIRINDTGGLGLTQIEARIKIMKGVFNINSSKETGTRIYISVPILDLD